MTTTKIHRDWEDRLTTPPDGWREGTFTNARGQKLPYALSLPNEQRGHVIYVEGLNEPREKMRELARDFNHHALGFSVFDRMGQAHGGRFLKNRFKVHSQGFDHDVADLIQFAETITPKGMKATLLGHSTGGLIAMMAYHDRPDLFTEPFINAPLIGMNHKLMKGREESFARLKLSRWMQELYIPGGRDWRLRGTGGLLPQDAYSRHPERMKLHDFFPEQNPSLRMGDPTIGWVWRACQAMVKVRNPAWLAKLGPVTIATAGQDVITNNEQVERCIPYIPHVRHIHLPEARHETPFETDDIRNRVIAETVKLALTG